MGTCSKKKTYTYYVPSPQEVESWNRRQEAKRLATDAFKEKVEKLVLAYESGDLNGFFAITNGVPEMWRASIGGGEIFGKLLTRHGFAFNYLEEWPKFSSERELNAFLELHLSVGNFICETLCAMRYDTVTAGQQEAYWYGRLTNLKSHCETNGLPLQAEVVSKHLKSLVDHIESESGFTRRCVRRAAAWEEERAAVRHKKADLVRRGLLSYLRPLSVEGYTPKWLGEIDELVDRVEAVKCEKSGRP